MIAGAASGQVEQGDSEVNFIGFYSTMVGTENSLGGFGTIMFNYGYFVTSHLEIGIGPQISFSSSEEGTETKFAGTAFMNFNFSTSSRMVPYISAQWYQTDFEIAENQSFTDLSYVNVGLGLRSFFNKHLALNNSVNYGFSLAEDAEGGMLLFMSGLTFVF
jgi:hypothetical protein